MLLTLVMGARQLIGTSIRAKMFNTYLKKERHVKLYFIFFIINLIAMVKKKYLIFCDYFVSRV